MKEATGGALLMGLAVIMIMVFIIMAAFFISYGKTFRLKNAIINKIEQSEGMSESEIKDFVSDKTTVYVGKTFDVCYSKVGEGATYKGFIMKVRVLMEMDKTILNSPFKLGFKVSGETRIIEKGNYYNEIANGRGIEGISECDNYTEITG